MLRQPANLELFNSLTTNNQQPTSAHPANPEPPNSKLSTNNQQRADNPPSYGITLGGLKNIKNAARDKLQADANRNVAIEMSNENLSDSWRLAVENIAADKMLYKSAILESVLTFEGHAITIHANVVSFDYLKGERIRLLDFFKAFYHNEKINVLFAPLAIQTQKKEDQVLSTREIFELMAERNPNLRILKDKLGLDIEY